MTWISGGGPPRLLPLDVDFYDLSNEDIGFTSNLADSNRVFAFALPYPAGINLFEETIRVYEIDIYMIGITSAQPDRQDGFQVYMSMLDKEFSATWDHIRDDAEDENIKAHFTGPHYVGVMFPGVATAASAEGGTGGRPADNLSNLQWYPPTEFLDLVTPLFIQFVRQSFDYTLATGAAAITDFTAPEAVGVRVWFKPRRLTSAEMNSRSNQLRWQRLDS